MRETASLTGIALRKYKKDFRGVFSFLFLIFCVFLAVFAYVLAPDNSRNANQMHLSLHSRNPGFEVTMLTVPAQVPDQPKLSKFFFGIKNPDTEIPVSSYTILEDAVVYTDYTEDGGGEEKKIDFSLFPEKTTLSNFESQYISQKKFFFGTDKYGRDLLSRMLIGTRVSLSIGFVAVFISLIIGVSLGALAGYFGGKTDLIIMWLINVTWSVPTLLLVIAISLALGKGFWQVFIAVGLTMWVEVARVVRGQVMSIREMEYVAAARALGYNGFRILTKHILPNAMAPVIIISAANFATAILVESGLSFLGIGAQPPIPSWGGIIKDHYSYIILGKPFLAIIPGLAIMSLVTAFMMTGNALRDAFDVRSNSEIL